MTGIRTLADVKDRCRIDPDTGCWLWSMSRNATGSPIMWYWNAEGVYRSTTGARAVYELRHGKPLARGVTAWTACGKACCNPVHVRTGTKAQHAVLLSKQQGWKGRPNRRAANTATARKHCATINIDIARQIRHSALNGRECAREFGVSEQLVSKVRRNQAWRESIAGASVFALGGA